MGFIIIDFFFIESKKLGSIIFYQKSKICIFHRRIQKLPFFLSSGTGGGTFQVHIPEGWYDRPP